MLWLLSGPLEFTCWISFAPVFSFMYCSVLFFPSSPLHVLRDLGDDAWISLGSFMQSNHLGVLIPIETKGEVGAP